MQQEINNFKVQLNGMLDNIQEKDAIIVNLQQQLNKYVNNYENNERHNEHV